MKKYLRKVLKEQVNTPYPWSQWDAPIPLQPSCFGQAFYQLVDQFNNPQIDHPCDLGVVWDANDDGIGDNDGESFTYTELCTNTPEGFPGGMLGHTDAAGNVIGGDSQVYMANQLYPDGSGICPCVAFCLEEGSGWEGGPDAGEDPVDEDQCSNFNALINGPPNNSEQAEASCMLYFQSLAGSLQPGSIWYQPQYVQALSDFTVEGICCPDYFPETYFPEWEGGTGEEEETETEVSIQCHAEG